MQDRHAPRTEDDQALAILVSLTSDRPDALFSCRADGSEAALGARNGETVMWF